jgi:hypothetical protein
MIAAIGADKAARLQPGHGLHHRAARPEARPVKLLTHAESDPGPYPVPDNAPIENWPMQRNEDTKALPKPGQTLEDIQRTGTGTAHPRRRSRERLLYEFWQGRRTDEAGRPPTRRRSTCKTGALRPERWTSSDAAGLPIFPAVVRYDECAAGMVEHAMRFTVRRRGAATCCPPRTGRAATRNETCRAWASASGLRKDFDVSGFPPHAQAILKGLKTYGMFVADNGSDWLMSIAPDRRLQGLETLAG